MRRTTLAVSAVAALALAALVAPSAQASAPELATHGQSSVSADPAVPYFARGVTHQARIGAARPTRSPVMTSHGGAVLNSANVTAVLWGSSWPTDTSDKKAGIADFWAGYGGSHYAGTSTEYTGSGSTKVTTSVTYKTSYVDGTAASGGNNPSPILAEVQKLVTNTKITLVGDGTDVIPVYTDLPRGAAGYCAWHASGNVTLPSGATTQVQFHFYWKLDGDAGCDPQDPSTVHSEGLEALANVSGHEMSETMTDPNTSGVSGTAGWYDSSGAENGDKCAWTFGAPSVTFSNGTAWKIQGEWSNAAYTAGTGYPNSSGQKGCLAGA
jgi:hypothetical protein